MSIIETQRAEESEHELIERARTAVDASAWIIGECAAEWTAKYAKGRTDADFGDLVGLTRDQVAKRRAVWERFQKCDLNHTLTWTHFSVALNWEDADECLRWASELEATVAEMKAWRRANHGETLQETRPKAVELTPAHLPDSAKKQHPEPERSQDRETQERPTIRKTTEATRKIPEEEKPRTASITTQTVQPAEDAETRLAFALREIRQVIEAVEDRKKIARQFRKLADEIDPPKCPIPTQEDVADYVVERGWTGFDAVKFWNHYQLAGWKYGKAKTPIANWHIAASQAWDSGKGWASGSAQGGRHELTANDW